jgi:hypothetical protein
VNPAAGPKPLGKVVFDGLGRNIRQGNLSEYRAQEFHSIQILLVISFAPERRLGTPLQEPARPLHERQMFAVQDS